MSDSPTISATTWGVTIGLVVLLLAVSGGALTSNASADQAKKAKRADLVVKSVTGSVAGRTAQVSAKVTNKPGKKKGKKSKAAADVDVDVVV